MKNIVVVGVGALGSHVVQFLRNVEASVTAIDFDRVEQKNVQSQFHTKSSVGKNKVVGLQQAMQFLFGKKIDVVPHKLAETNTKELLGKADLVIDCLDNGESRRVIQGYVRVHNVPCLHGALAADGGFGRVIWDEMFAIDDESLSGQPTCEGGEHLPFIAITAAFIARAAQEFITSGSKKGYSVSPAGVIRV